MLTFHDAVWASARECAANGRRAEALTRLAPLLSSPDTPPALLLLAHRLAARVRAAGENYRAARKHLFAAADLAPQTAEIHYELGVAFERDPYGCDRRAARRFRKAVKLNPREAKYAAALGRALVRINRVRAGVKYLRTAAELAPSSAVVLKVVADGLCDANRANEAARLVTKARFLAPADAKLRKLADDVRYAVAQQAQRCGGGRKVGAGPTMLPFLWVETGERGSPNAGGIVRRDTVSRVAPHMGRLRAFRG
jgi:Flp pilus assembly protein TadD